MKKKIISLFLSVVMVFTMIPTYTVAFAAENADNHCNHMFSEATLPDDDSDFWIGHSKSEYYAGSSAFVSVTVPGTCDEDGWKIDKSWNEETQTGTGFCVVCGEIVTDGDKYVDDSVKATGHSYQNDADNYDTVKAPTCTEKGLGECTNVYKVFSVEQKADGLYQAVLTDHECTQTTDIPATGHSWDEGKVTAPTCEDDGFTTYTCTVCGETAVNLKEGDAVEKLGHHYVGTVTTKPTCETKGKETFVCKNDPAHTYVQEISATGHNWKLISTTNPTCTEDGYEEYVCLNDKSHTKTECPDALKAKGHSWSEWEVKQEATCQYEGQETRTCTVCGEKEFRTIEKSEHKIENQEIVVEGNCTQGEVIKGYCSNCKQIVVVTKNPPGHKYENPDSIVVTAPTCTEIGYTTYTCSVCGEKHITDLKPAKGHTPGEPVVKVTPAQCEADGLEVTTVTCTVCGVQISKKEVILPAIGHDYVATVTAPTCEEGGYTTYVCQNDKNHTYIADETAPIGHDWEVKDRVESTCTQEGKITYVCKNDPSHTKEESLPLKAHEYKITETRYPDCTNDGYHVWTCVNCGTASYIETLKALGHQYDPDSYQHIDATCVSGNIEIYGPCIRPIINPETGQPIDANGDGVIDEGDYCGYDQGPIEDEARDYTAAFTGDIEYTQSIDVEPENIPAGAVLYVTTTGDFELAHTGHDYDVTFVPARCEFDAYWLYTCKRSACPDSKNTVNHDIVIALANSATGHNWALRDDDTNRDPSCTEDGTRHWVCLNDHNHVYTEKIPATGHNWLLKDTVDATCTEGGYNLYECQNVANDNDPDSTAGTKCDATYKEYITPAKGHNYVVTASVAATCTTQGYDVYTCTVCGDTYNKTTTPATGHQFVAKGFTEPTCTSYGFTTYECVNADCKESFTADYISAKGHNYVANVTAPTCDTEGYTTYHCDVCGHMRTNANGDIYKDNFTNRTDHVLNVVKTINATCTEDGKVIKTCVVCGKDVVEVLPATGHNWGKKEVVDATCTSEGYTKYTCTNDGCNENFVTNKTDKVNHVLNTVKTIAPTCGADGEKISECVNCDYVQHEVIPATGNHQYDEKVTKNPTCAEKGEMTYTCSVCGYTYTEELAKTDDHAFSDAIETPATCGKDGVMKHVCEVCGYTYTTVIPATGDHKYDEKVTKNPTCAEKGEMTYTCSVCGYTYTEELAKTDDHAFSDAIETPATCGKDGVMKHVCEVCGYTYTTVIPALTHNYTYVEKAATCTSNGTMTATCKNCGDVQKYTIPAKGHIYDTKGVYTPPTCVKDGYTTYTCTVCKKSSVTKMEGKALGHTYKAKVTTPSKLNKNGTITTTCIHCGKASKTSIAAIKSITLSQTTYQYTGSAFRPKVTVKDSKGKVVSSKNYTVSYSSNKNIGTAKVKIKFKGNYSGTVTKTFKIIPKNVGISVVSTKKKEIKFTWGKVKACNGYQIQYSTSKSFKSPKTIKITSQKTCSKTIKKLKSGKKYYIRIRAYKTVNGKNIYGNWSKTSKTCK